MKKSLRTRFVVLCTARTGSNLLTFLLMKHANIDMHGEIFNLSVLEASQLKKVLTNPLQCATEFFDVNSYPEEIEAIGFKLFYNHLTPEFFRFSSPPHRSSETLVDYDSTMLKLLSEISKECSLNNVYAKFEKTWKYLYDEKDIKIIHLKRKNKFDTFVSLKTAFVTKKWMEYPGQLSSKTLMEIQPEECSLFFNQIDYYEKFYADMFKTHPIFEVDYQQLVENRDLVIQEIFKFLGVAPAPVHVVMNKQMKHPLNEVVTNYGDLKRHFSNTRWAGYFPL